MCFKLCFIAGQSCDFPGPKNTESDASLGRGDARTRDSSFSLSVCNSSRVGYFLSGSPLARTVIKQSNLVALLDFPKVIRPNESNPDCETTCFVVV